MKQSGWILAFLASMGIALSFFTVYMSARSAREQRHQTTLLICGKGGLIDLAYSREIEPPIIVKRCNRALQEFR